MTSPHTTHFVILLLALSWIGAGCTHETRAAARGKASGDAAKESAREADDDDDDDDDEKAEAMEGGAKAKPLPAEIGESDRISIGFDEAAVGALPGGWSAAETHGAGSPGHWAVAAVDGAPSGHNVLRLDTKNTGGTFNLLLSEREFPADVDVSVKIHPNSGSEDRGGGLVWRCKDSNNYYVARWNPLETNLRVYKVEDGKRSMFESADLQADANAWHTLQARMRGATIEISFDGKVLLTHSDSTFPAAGKVGLWTKADASSSFDDLTVSWPRAK
jgi:hypothetical protein